MRTNNNIELIKNAIDILNYDLSKRTEPVETRKIQEDLMKGRQLRINQKNKDDYER